MIGLVQEGEAGRTGERGTYWLQPDRSAAFNTMRRPLEQTAQDQDDDAGKNHDLCGHSTPVTTTKHLTQRRHVKNHFHIRATSEHPWLNLSGLLPSEGPT